MKTIDVNSVKEAIKDLFLSIGNSIDPKVLDRLQRQRNICTNPTSRFALEIMAKNAEIAKRNNIPVCQDTGMAVVFVDIGQDVHLVNGEIESAINDGVRQAYSEGYYRKSVLSPLKRVNTGDNTPAIIHYNIVGGETIKLSVMCKGFGSENMSRLFMLTPSVGIQGVKDCIVRAVSEGAANPCPPVIVGVGIGGTMEKAALMSKKVLFREIDSINGDPELAALESELVEEINKLNIGAGGYGDSLTALAVLIDSYPTHLAGLPVAITIQCHASRHAQIIIS